MKSYRSLALFFLLLLALTPPIVGQENPIVRENKKPGSTHWLLFQKD